MLRLGTHPQKDKLVKQ